MYKREHTTMSRSHLLKYSAIILFPPLFFFLLLFLLKNMQPQPILINGNEISDMTITVNDDYYYLKGIYECIPGELVAPEDFDSYDNIRTNTYLTDIFDSDYMNQDTLQATMRFHLSVSSEEKVSFFFPGIFCEYMVYANGRNIACTKTFHSHTPAYPAPAIINLPPTEDGEYEILIQVITPPATILISNTSIILGSRKVLEEAYVSQNRTSLVIIALIVVTIFFCLVQLFTMQKERITLSFIYLAIAFLFRFLFSDDVVIMRIFPFMTYDIGSMILSLITPVFLLMLIYHEYSLFAPLFPKTWLKITCILQVFPLMTSLMGPASLMIFTVLKYAAYASAGVLCTYVIIRALHEKYPYCALFYIGLIQCLIGALVEYISSTLPIRTSHSLLSSFLAFSFIEMIILARKYSAQHASELFYSDELNRTLEEMQASENAFLNAQMKPHFLYNTLNTIADLCVTDPDKAKSMLESLKEYCGLILSIDNVDKTVPLSREMELVTAYTSIEKERFPSINFYSDFPIRMPKVNIPPLTLQPLIENAIKHGVRKSSNPEIITLRIRESVDNVTFYVSDNGAGMSEETIEKLFVRPIETKSIGIYNIDKRLKNLYKTGLNVESTPGLGTCISFSVPK